MDARERETKRNQEEAAERVCLDTVLMPSYYKSFHCLAEACQDHCCGGWKIAFDKKDYFRLRRLDAPKELKERVDRTVCRLRGDPSNMMGCYAEFRLGEDRCCPLLDPDGLCSLQKGCGEEALPRVCREFPRKTQRTVMAKEYTLSPACEGVLQLLWDRPEGIDFIQEPLPEKERAWASLTTEEDNLWKFFPQVRSLWIDMLQDRTLPLPRRLLLLGIALQNLRERDWSAPDVEGWLDWAGSLVGNPAAAELLRNIAGNREMFLAQNRSTAERMWGNGGWLERLLLREDGTPYTRGEIMELYPQVNGAYLTHWYEEGTEALRESLGEREYFFENLMVAISFHLGTPALGSKEVLWKSYVNCCNLYSFYRFITAVGCRYKAEKTRLFHLVVLASRGLIHNAERMVEIRDGFFEHHSDSLAHMAILVSG